MKRFFFIIILFLLLFYSCSDSSLNADLDIKLTTVKLHIYYPEPFYDKTQIVYLKQLPEINFSHITPFVFDLDSSKCFKIDLLPPYTLEFYHILRPILFIELPSSSDSFWGRPGVWGTGYSPFNRTIMWHFTFESTFNNTVNYTIAVYDTSGGKLLSFDTLKLDFSKNFINLPVTQPNIILSNIDTVFNNHSYPIAFDFPYDEFFIYKDHKFLKYPYLIAFKTTYQSKPVITGSLIFTNTKLLYVEADSLYLYRLNSYGSIPIDSLFNSD